MRKCMYLSTCTYSVNKRNNVQKNSLLKWHYESVKWIQLGIYRNKDNESSTNPLFKYNGNHIPNYLSFHVQDSSPTCRL